MRIVLIDSFAFVAVAAGALLLVDDSARAFLSGCWPKQHEQNAGWQDAQERRSEQSSHSNLHRPGGNKPRWVQRGGRAETFKAGGERQMAARIDFTAV
jgi:hypothetical protein